MKNEDLYFQLPTEETTNPLDVLFQIPGEMTGGMYVNVWLAGLYGVLMLGALQYNQDYRSSSLFASFGTFITAFMLVILSGFTSEPVAGGNQLIPAAVVLAANLLWNYISGGRRI